MCRGNEGRDLLELEEIINASAATPLPQRGSFFFARHYSLLYLIAIGYIGFTPPPFQFLDKKYSEYKIK